MLGPVVAEIAPANAAERDTPVIEQAGVGDVFCPCPPGGTIGGDIV